MEKIPLMMNAYCNTNQLALTQEAIARLNK